MSFRPMTRRPPGPMARRRHLVRTRGRFVMTACGLRNPPLTTHDPALVTCRACRRTMFMADTELRRQRSVTERRSNQ